MQPTDPRFEIFTDLEQYTLRFALNNRRTHLGQSMIRYPTEGFYTEELRRVESMLRGLRPK